MDNFESNNENLLTVTILRSKLPTAKKFKHWVTSEVLPSIRKTGMYINVNDALAYYKSPQFLIDIGMEIKALEEKNKKLEDLNTEMKPYAAVGESLLKSEGNILVREMAKIASNHEEINVGEKKLYEILRNWGLILKTRNEPSQFARKNGLMILKEGVTTINGGTVNYRTPKITPKGQQYILKKLRDAFGVKDRFVIDDRKAIAA